MISNKKKTTNRITCIIFIIQIHAFIHFRYEEKHVEAKKILLPDYINGSLGNKLQLNWLKVKDFEDLKKDLTFMVIYSFN